ncbi:MAG: RtcB family protein [Cyanobacteria bacterium REEB67]|nr:RtcB family protein [Cyanobacteria bacterium REEB67]
MTYELITARDCKPIKAWVKGVPLEPEAHKQLLNLASLPFIHKHIAVMPDAHLGRGSTIGSVIPTHRAIVPAAVGVDLGCGMIAVATTLRAVDLPDDLKALRTAIERAVPVGTGYFRNGHEQGDPACEPVNTSWASLKDRWDLIEAAHPALREPHAKHINQLGTLGGGNHFIEILLDDSDRVWLMLHSGSRGIGNRVGTHFIELARKEMCRNNIQLPDRDLAYLSEGAQHFDDYLFAVQWAQDYAFLNRQIMMGQVQHALKQLRTLPAFESEVEVINCHHNYVAREDHFGDTVWVTRKGAVRAAAGDWGIIPGSMGAGSYIVRGKGNPESFNSCSHGAGRAMSRTAARKNISMERHASDTAHVECRKDEGILDESPAAYKSLDAVMRAQADLVDIVHKLRPLVCVKG